MTYKVLRMERNGELAASDVADANGFMASQLQLRKAHCERHGIKLYMEELRDTMLMDSDPQEAHDKVNCMITWLRLQLCIRNCSSCNFMKDRLHCMRVACAT